jgi:hypothetical protein
MRWRKREPESSLLPVQSFRGALHHRIQLAHRGRCCAAFRMNWATAAALLDRVFCSSA